MTMRTRHPITCPCGHKGTIRMTENDQPFSSPYGSYSLEDLKGNSFYIDGFADWEQVFDEMKPTCPKCGMLLTEANFDVKNA